MADRNFKEIRGSLRPNVVILCGTLIIDTDASVKTGTFFDGGTFTKTGTGEYTLTLQDSYPTLLACHTTMLMATAADRDVNLKSADVVTAKTIVIRTTTGSTGAATDLGALSQVHVVLMLGNSGAL